MGPNKFSRKNLLFLILITLLVISIILVIFLLGLNENVPAFNAPSSSFVEETIIDDRDELIKESDTTMVYNESPVLNDQTHTSSSSCNVTNNDVQLNEIANNEPITNNNNAISSNNNVFTPLLSKEELYKLPATTVIDMTLYENNYKELFFYEIALDETIKHRITAISYQENDFITFDDLRYIRVLYYGFDGNTHIGELIVNKSIALDVVDIFYELYEANYPIEKMILIDDYMGDDEASMNDNNTSAFNFRLKTGSTSLSNHGKGLAIDINPLYNPYVKENNNTTIILPADSKDHVDRTFDHPYYIKLNDLCYNAFTKRGFTWGGSWNSLKDYQHFEKAK